MVAALVREGSVIIPRGDTVVRAGDLVIIFAASKAVKKVEKIFAVKLEFF
jgi:trk system potassium uptake protein TrkA